jgi:OOP family OmpA-OmpF porin
VPAKPQTHGFIFSGDALFAFDESTLKPEGMRMLDEMAWQVEGTTLETFLVTGHADRFGSPQYNQQLLERRANTVKNYLMGKHILTSRIDAEGTGGRQPMIPQRECPSRKSTKIIACLQRDCRVDVKMTGTSTVSAMR